MVKKIFIKMAIDFTALFIIFCGIDLILSNPIDTTTNIFIALLVAFFKNMLNLKRYYQTLIEEEKND